MVLHKDMRYGIPYMAICGGSSYMNDYQLKSIIILPYPFISTHSSFSFVFLYQLLGKKEA